MEPRRLIKLGNSSFAIALPKDWVENSGLKKGEQVFIEKGANGEIIISSKFKKINEEKKVLLDLKEKDETSLQVALIGAYLKDYNVIKIKNNLDAKNKKHVKELVKNLLSFEIIEENNEEIIWKDLFSIEGIEIKGFIRRMDNLIRGFFEDINKGIKDGKITTNISSEIQIADKEITKLYLLVNKVFIKSLNSPALVNSIKSNSVSIFNDYWVALHLEKIGDRLKHIAKVLEKTDKCCEELKIFVDKMNKSYLDTMLSYYNSNINMAENIVSNNKKLFSELECMEIKEVDATKIAEELKSLNGDIFQISKIVTYSN